MARGFALWLGVSAMLLVSPARLEMVAYRDGRLTPAGNIAWGNAIVPLRAGDLDGDGAPETLRLEHGEAAITQGAEAAWRSPAEWQVWQGWLADLDGDGRLEAALLVWRAFRPWPIDSYLPYGGRIAGHQTAAGKSCHLALIGWREGAYREMWVGSALARPLLAMLPADMDGDGRMELAVLEGEYAKLPGAGVSALQQGATAAQWVSLWEWNGFGFSLLDRLEGNYFSLSTLIDGERTLLLLQR